MQRQYDLEILTIIQQAKPFYFFTVMFWWKKLCNKHIATQLTKLYSRFNMGNNVFNAQMYASGAKMITRITKITNAKKESLNIIIP